MTQRATQVTQGATPRTMEEAARNDDQVRDRTAQRSRQQLFVPRQRRQLKASSSEEPPVHRAPTETSAKGSSQVVPESSSAVANTSPHPRSSQRSSRAHPKFDRKQTIPDKRANKHRSTTQQRTRKVAEHRMSSSQALTSAPSRHPISSEREGGSRPSGRPQPRSVGPVGTDSKSAAVTSSHAAKSPSTRTGGILTLPEGVSFSVGTEATRTDTSRKQPSARTGHHYVRGGQNPGHSDRIHKALPKDRVEKRGDFGRLPPRVAVPLLESSERRCLSAQESILRQVKLLREGKNQGSYCRLVDDQRRLRSL